MLQNAYLLAKIGADTAENISGDGGSKKKCYEAERLRALRYDYYMFTHPIIYIEYREP